MLATNMFLRLHSTNVWKNSLLHQPLKRPFAPQKMKPALPEQELRNTCVQMNNCISFGAVKTCENHSHWTMRFVLLRGNYVVE